MQAVLMEWIAESIDDMEAAKIAARTSPASPAGRRAVTKSGRT